LNVGRRLWHQRRTFSNGMQGVKAKKPIPLKDRPPQRLNTGMQITHYSERQRKFLFRFALGCWGTVLGIASFGYTLSPSFRVKDSICEYSDHKIRDRLRHSYLHFLTGFFIMGCVITLCMRNPELRQSLYAFGDDEIFAAVLTLGIPAYFTCVYTKPENTVMLYISSLVFWISMGFAQVSGLIVPGVLFRRGLWPWMSMLTCMTLTCSAAANPWYMENFSLVSGYLGIGAGWAISHALYGRHFKQFEIFYHLALFMFATYLSMHGVNSQISYAMNMRVYPLQSFPLSWFAPSKMTWVHELREKKATQTRSIGNRAGGSILENPLVEEQEEDHEKALYLELQKAREARLRRESLQRK